MNAEAPIGVFDSGVGGLSILRALRAELPGEDFVYVADSGFAPYGERNSAHVVDRSRTVLGHLQERHGIKALVVACNTATAVAIQVLRAENPALPLVGVEPAVKPAVAISRTGRIGVLATRGTLASDRFKALLAAHGGDAAFALQACDGLAHAIETDDAPKTRALCREYTLTLGTFGTENGAIDTLVLGCTHYPFAEAELRDCVGPDVRLIETGLPVAQQTRRLLAGAGLLNPAHGGSLRLFSTGIPGDLAAAATRWLGTPATAHAL